jgi:predicted nuclease with RNAse H fold
MERDRKEALVSTTLKHFLAALATDREKLAEYLRSPDEVVQEAGLSEADRAALRGRDPRILEARLELEDPAGLPGSRSLADKPRVEASMRFACLLRGIGSVIELIPPTPALPPRTAADALREDWRRIGGDLHRAIDRILAGQRCESWRLVAEHHRDLPRRGRNLPRTGRGRWC